MRVTRFILSNIDMAALMVLVLVPVVFTALCMVTQLGTSNLQMCSLLIRTRARHGCLFHWYGIISGSYRSGWWCSFISELSAPLDSNSMVVSLPRFGLKASVSTHSFSISLNYVGTIGHFICILYTVPIDSIAYGYSYMQ